LAAIYRPFVESSGEPAILQTVDAAWNLNCT